MNCLRSPRVSRVCLCITLVLAALPALAGCDLIDEIINSIIDGGGGTSGAPTAVITADVSDDLVNLGLNPDLRPPLWYQFSSGESLSEDGLPIFDPMAGMHDLAWDFGDGTVRGFEWSDSTPRHRFREEGTYIVRLSVRDAVTGRVSSVEETIVIGPAWLGIVSVSVSHLPNGNAELTVVVKNQSQQDLRVFGVELLVDGVLLSTGIGVSLSELTQPDRLVPQATYTLTRIISSWTGLLTVRSGECTPWP